MEVLPIELQWKPIENDVVAVSNDGVTWFPAVFLKKEKYCNHPYIMKYMADRHYAFRLCDPITKHFNIPRDV